jgi:crossover junction endodeoxyribonuclease RusA
MPTPRPLAFRGVIVEVRGLPKPAGSKRVFLVGPKGGTRRPVVTDDCRKGADWRATVQHAIANAYQGPPMECALEVSLHFTVPRPRGHFNKRGELRPSAPAFPTTRPDRSKLCRAVEDAATGLLWRDDAQIICGALTKGYGARVGVVILCRPLVAFDPRKGEA